MKAHKEKIIAATLTALLFGSIIGSFILFRSNTRLNDGLSDEKLRSESLLNEKANLTKEIDKLKKDFTALVATNQKNENSLAEMVKKIQEKENRIGQLTKENNSVKDLRKQVADLQQLKSELEKQLQNFREENLKLMADNEIMENLMASLKSTNASLNQDLNNAKLIAADKFLVQSLKGKKKEKLTLNANKTRKLAVGFDLPGDIITDLKFHVITPSGRKITQNDKSLSWIVPGDTDILVASLDGIGSDIKVSKRVEMTYEPESKMEKGIYTIKIFTGEIYTGSCQVRLR